MPLATRIHRSALVVSLVATGATIVACSGDDQSPGGQSGGAGGTTNGGSAGAHGGSPPKAGESAGGGAGRAAGNAGATSGSGGSGSGGVAAAGSGGAGGRSNLAGGAGVGAAGAASGTGGAAAGAGGRMGGDAGRSGKGGMGAAAGAAGAAAGMSGAAGAAGAGGMGTIPLKNPPVLSSGCGKPSTVTSGKKTITSTGQQRSYIIDIPTDYDMNKPYRLFYTSHWIGSTSEAVRDQDYYFLKPLANAAKEPAIFVAPQADGDTWQEKDHALFDDLLAYVKENLCIDTTRVFATGFSFGGMITYSLSVNHQKDIRAAVGIAPANYNIYVPPKTHEPIAWMQTTGMSDTTCPWINGSSTTQGSKFIAIEHATDNGCTVPTSIPTWQSGNHVCYDFTGCKAEYPTKVCTFNGGHTNISNEGGSNWIPTESWAFFTQF